MCFFKRKKKKLEENKATSSTLNEQEHETQQPPTTQVESNDECSKTKKTSTSKTVEEKSVSAKPEKTRKALYRVLYDKENRAWVIKKDGAKRTIASFATKEAALARVKELSTSKDINFVVHKKDGKFQKK